MPVRRVRYKPNHTSFGEMMMSDQTADFAEAAARDIAALATATQRLSEAPYEVDTAVPPVVLNDPPGPRRVAHVVGNDPLHAAEEFGTGTQSTGEHAGKPRPQKGSSPPRRTLATAANTIVPPMPRRTPGRKS